MAVSHVFSSPVPDFTGTVTVFNSLGLTETKEASVIVRPSNWNSVHNQFMTLSGNTAGDSTLSGTNLVLEGGNRITLSGVGQTIVMVGAAALALSAAGASASAGTVIFSNSNGIGFGQNGSTITASHNGLTSQSNQAFSAPGGSSAFQTLVFANSQGVSWSNSNGSVVATVQTDYASSNHSHGNPTLNLTNLSGTTASNSAGLTLSLSAASQTNQTIGVYGSSNTTAQSSSSTVDARSLTFRGMGVASVGLSAGEVVISVPAGGGGGMSAGMSTEGNTAGTTSVVSNRLIFVGSGAISLSQSANGASATLSILGPATSSLSVTGALSASSNGATISLGVGTVTVSATSNTTQASSGTIDLNAMILQGRGGVSVGISNGSLVFSGGAGGAETQTGISGIQVSDTTYTSGTVTFRNANGISFGSSGAQGISASYTVPTVTNSSMTVSDAATSGTLARLAFTNLNGVTLSLSTGAGGSHTIVGSHNALTSQSNQAFSAGAASSAFQTLIFQDSLNLSFSNNAGSLRVTHNLAGTSTGFAGANISGSITHNSSGINLSLSVAAPGAAAENNWFTLTGDAAGNVVGNSSASGSTIMLSGRNLTLSGTNNSQIMISAPATSSLVGASGIQVSTAGSTISVLPIFQSFFAYPVAVVNTQTVLAAQSNTSYIFPIELRDVEAIGFLKMLQTVSLSSMASIATAANNTKSYTQEATFNFVLYSRGIGASSQSLQSVGSTSHSSRMGITVGQNANGSEWSVTHGFSFPATNTGQTTRTFTYATTLTNVNVSTTHLTALSGAKQIGFPWATTLSAQQYWLMVGAQTAQTTNGNASLSNMRVTASNMGVSQINFTYGEFGSASNSSIAQVYGLGSYTKAATGTTGSLGFSDISSASSHIQPFLTFARIA